MTNSCGNCKKWTQSNELTKYGACTLLSNNAAYNHLEVIFPDVITVNKFAIETHRDFGCSEFEQKEAEE